MKITKKQILVASIAGLTGFMGLFYTNMTSNDISVYDYVNESGRLAQYLDKQTEGSEAYELIRQHKLKVSSFISAKTASRDCAELLKNDPYLVSGRYFVFPEKDVAAPVVMECEVSGGVVHSQALVETPLEILSEETPIIKENLVCGVEPNYLKQAGRDKVYCTTEGLIAGVPVLKKEYSQGKCILNETYGVDENGLWLFSGCRGEFEVLSRILETPRSFDEMVYADESYSTASHFGRGVGGSTVFLESSSSFSARGQNVEAYQESQSGYSMGGREVSSSAPTSGLGQLDFANYEAGHLVLKGWACHYGNSNSISVKVYVGGPKGQGQFLGTIPANIDASNLRGTCGSSSRLHSFRGYFLVPEELALNQKVYLYGSTSDESGTYEFPVKGSGKNIDAPAVIGRIDGVKLEGSDVVISGWACHIGISRPIEVNIYYGGPYGTGKEVRDQYANQPSEAAISTICKTKGTSHRFVVKIRHTGEYKGAPIYINGSRLVEGPPSSIIENSGEFRVP